MGARLYDPLRRAEASLIQATTFRSKLRPFAPSRGRALPASAAAVGGVGGEEARGRWGVVRTRLVREGEVRWGGRWGQQATRLDSRLGACSHVLRRARANFLLGVTRSCRWGQQATRPSLYCDAKRGRVYASTIGTKKRTASTSFGRCVWMLWRYSSSPPQAAPAPS